MSCQILTASKWLLKVQFLDAASLLGINHFLPAFEYERAHRRTLQPFLDSSVPYIRHPEIKAWASDLMTAREQMKESESLAEDR